MRACPPNWSKKISPNHCGPASRNSSKRSSLITSYQHPVDVAGVAASLVPAVKSSVYRGSAIALQMHSAHLLTSVQMAFVVGISRALQLTAAIAGVSALVAVVRIAALPSASSASGSLSSHQRSRSADTKTRIPESASRSPQRAPVARRLEARCRHDPSRPSNAWASEIYVDRCPSADQAVSSVPFLTLTRGRQPATNLGLTATSVAPKSAPGSSR